MVGIPKQATETQNFKLTHYPNGGELDLCERGFVI
jgi:hypothetical protein